MKMIRRRAEPASLLLLLLPTSILLLFLAAQPAAGYVVTSRKVELMNELTEFETFGMIRGARGNVTVSVPASARTLHLLVCSRSEVYDAAPGTMQAQSCGIIKNGDKLSCRHAVWDEGVPLAGRKVELAPGTVTNVGFHAKHRSVYHFVLSHCDAVMTESPVVTVSMLLLNGDSHLDFRYASAPLFSQVLVWLWGAIVVVAAGLQAFPSVSLKREWVLPVLPRLIAVYCGMLYWMGYQDHGEPSNALWIAEQAMKAVGEGMFFVTLSTLARGLHILVTRLDALQQMMCLAIGFSASVFILSVLNGYSLVILYFFMMPYIVTSITDNIRLIKVHLVVFLATGIRPSHPGLDVFLARLRQFNRLKSIALSYWILFVVAVIVRMLVPWPYVMLNDVVHEAIAVIGIVCLTVAFARLPRDPPPPLIPDQAIMNIMMSLNDEELAAWDPFETIAYARNNADPADGDDDGDAAISIRTEYILASQPACRDEHGRWYTPLAIALPVADLKPGDPGYVGKRGTSRKSDPTAAARESPSSRSASSTGQSASPPRQPMILSTGMPMAPGLMTPERQAAGVRGAFSLTPSPPVQHNTVQETGAAPAAVAFPASGVVTMQQSAPSTTTSTAASAPVVTTALAAPAELGGQSVEAVAEDSGAGEAATGADQLGGGDDDHGDDDNDDDDGDDDNDNDDDKDVLAAVPHSDPQLSALAVRVPDPADAEGAPSTLSSRADSDDAGAGQMSSEPGSGREARFRFPDV